MFSKPEQGLKQAIAIKSVILFVIVAAAYFLPIPREELQFLLFPVILLFIVPVFKHYFSNLAWVLTGFIFAFWLLALGSISHAGSYVLVPDDSRERAYRLLSLLEELRATRSFPQIRIDFFNFASAPDLKISAENEWLALEGPEEVALEEGFHLYLNPGSFNHSFEPEEITKHFVSAYAEGVRAFKNNELERASLYFTRAASFPGRWRSGEARAAAWLMAGMSEFKRGDLEASFSNIQRASGSFDSKENPRLYGRIMSNAGVVEYLRTKKPDAAIKMILKGLNISKQKQIEDNLVKLVEIKNKSTAS